MKWICHEKQDSTPTDPGETEEAARFCQTQMLSRDNLEIHQDHKLKKVDNYQEVSTPTY